MLGSMAGFNACYVASVCHLGLDLLPFRAAPRPAFRDHLWQRVRRDFVEPWVWVDSPQLPTEVVFSQLTCAIDAQVGFTRQLCFLSIAPCKVAAAKLLLYLPALPLAI